MSRAVRSHVLAHFGPDVEEDALSFVVAGAVLVGLAEVAGGDRPVHGGDDLAEGHLLGGPGEHVAAAHAAL